MSFSPLSLPTALTDRYVAPPATASWTVPHRCMSTTRSTPSSSPLGSRFSPLAMARDIRPMTLSTSGTASTISSSLSPLLVANHYMRNRSSLVSAISAPRLFSTAPPTGPTPPPPGPPPPGATTAGPAGPGTASAARLPVSFKNYPARYALAFVAIHPTIAWGLMTPMYFLCHYTSLSTLLLAGPGGGAVLNTRIPSFLPATAIYGLRETRARHELHNPGGSDPTVEEWMEMAIRKFASSSWQVAKGIRNLVTNVKGSVDGDFSPPGFDLKTMKRVQKVAADVQAQGLDGFKGDANEKKSWWHGYVKNRAEEIRFREVADGVAAYILIKALLPLRIPLSLWLTPKVVKRFI